jgi:hypothetical protein
MDKNDIIDLPVAIVQAWGWLSGAADSKFQVCYLLTPLIDAFMSDGESVPEFFAVSLDADQKDNPRREVLSYFQNRDADPIGPVAIKQVEAKNQQGWVWAFRECPMPTEAIESGAADRIVRSHHRQNWKTQAIRGAQLREAARAAVPPARQDALGAGGADDGDDLPF